MMKEMESRYDGRCTDCGEDIEAGDRIGYDGDAHCGSCLDIRRDLSDCADEMLAEIDGPAIAIALRCITSGDRCDAEVGEDARAVITGHDRDDLEIEGSIRGDLLGGDIWRCVMYSGIDSGKAGTNSGHTASGYWLYETSIRKEG